MATMKTTGVMTYVDDGGNHHILHPVTTAAAVEGLAEAFDDARAAAETAAQTAADLAERNAILYAADLHFTRQVSLPAGAWSAAAPYTMTVQVDGMKKTDTPHYGVVYSDDAAKRLLEKEAFGLIDDLQTDKNTVTFTCFEEKPAVKLTIQLEVNR